MTAAIKLKDALSWKESYDKHIQYIKKQKHHFADKAHTVKAVAFPVVMYRCESWTRKRLSTEELMLSNCGAREDLRVPWAARRSNQSILKEIKPEYSLEGLLLKLKL